MASLTQLAALFRRKQLELNDYVAAAAAGESYDAEAVVEILLREGKSDTDFTSAVELMQKRLAAVALLQSGDDTSGKLTDIQAAAVAAKDEYEEKMRKLGEKLEQKLADLQVDTAAVIERKSQLRAATQFLISTADPELVEQEREMSVLLRIAREKLQAAQRDAALAEYGIANPQKHTDIDAAEIYAAQLRQRRDSIQSEVDQLMADLEAIRSAKLEA